MISVAAQVAGMTSLVIDGDPRSARAVRHLVEDHHYRRIAFLPGPRAIPRRRPGCGSTARPWPATIWSAPESMVASGDFKYEAGVDAVAILLDQRRVAFDAIVVANDQMALGVIDALRARGVRVPRDVAIIGFDDIQEASLHGPAADHDPAATAASRAGWRSRPCERRLAVSRSTTSSPCPSGARDPGQLRLLLGRPACLPDQRFAAAASLPGMRSDGDRCARGSTHADPRGDDAAVAGLTEGIPSGWESDLLDSPGRRAPRRPGQRVCRSGQRAARARRCGRRPAGSAWQPAPVGAPSRADALPGVWTRSCDHAPRTCSRRPASWSAMPSSTARRNTG